MSECRPPTTPAPVEPAYRALAEGRHDVAIALLRDAAARPGSPEEQALLRLHLASADATDAQDDAAPERGRAALREAARIEPAVVRWPLYRALHWTFRASEGASPHAVRRGVAGIDPQEDPVAGYHAATALVTAGALKSAKRLLLALPAARLPDHLRWRRAAALGDVHSEDADWLNADASYREALAHAPEPARAGLQVHLASVRLESGDAASAGALLAELPAEAVPPAELSWARQLAGRADLELGNPGRALEALEDAYRTALDAEHRYGAVQALAQALASIGRPGEAAERLALALADAKPNDRAYLHHERGIALLDADRAEEAAASLHDALADPDYPHRAEAAADLADAHFREGRLREAAATAKRALEGGAVGPSCLTLGAIALEYFELDEAVAWFEQAASASTHGDPTWVAAQQSLADVFAQRGPEHAERLLLHARAALAHTEPASEWVAPLSRYVERARAQLGGSERWLN